MVWYNTHTLVWSPISAAWLGDRFGIARVVCFGTFCQSKSNEVRNGMGKHSHTGLVSHFGLPGWVTSLKPLWATSLGAE